MITFGNLNELSTLLRLELRGEITDVPAGEN